MPNTEMIIRIKPTEIGPEFYIILPADFIKLPHSMQSCFEDDIISAWLDNTIAGSFQYERLTTKTNEKFMPDSIKIWVEHTTDGEYTIVLPENLTGYPTKDFKPKDINDWLETNVYDAKRWGLAFP